MRARDILAWTDRRTSITPATATPSGRFRFLARRASHIAGTVEERWFFRQALADIRRRSISPRRNGWWPETGDVVRQQRTLGRDRHARCLRRKARKRGPAIRGARDRSGAQGPGSQGVSSRGAIDAFCRTHMAVMTTSGGGPPRAWLRATTQAPLDGVHYRGGDHHEYALHRGKARPWAGQGVRW